MSSDLDQLFSGYRKFREDYYPEHQDLYQTLVDQGQSPSTMVISCSDSRVDPGMILQTRPGDLFVVRNVANLVPPYQPDNQYHGISAALEYAVTILQVKVIVVLGHSSCGGVDALMRGCCGGDSPVGEFIAPWVNLAEKAWDRLPDSLKEKASSSDGNPDQEASRALEMANVALSMDNIEGFPFVREAVRAGILQVEGWYFDIASGSLFRRNQGEDNFNPIEGSAS